MTSFGQRISRRKFLTAAALTAAGLAVYAGEVERHWLEESRVEIRLKGLAESFDGMQIAQISDIHMDEFTEPFFLKHAIDRVNRMRPDLVMLTGDFVSDAPRRRKFAYGAAWQCADLLAGLNCRQRYAVMGNHDFYVGERQVTEALAAREISVLNNAYLPIEREGSRFWLAGVDDPLMGRPDPEKAIPESIRGIQNEPVVLMCHGPDYVDELAGHAIGRATGLVLSGHTHGGQVRVPFFGPLTLPEMGRKYVEGLFRVGEMQLYVNRGLGTVGVPFRFDCPPEITLITLRRG